MTPKIIAALVIIIAAFGLNRLVQSEFGISFLPGGTTFNKIIDTIFSPPQLKPPTSKKTTPTTLLTVVGPCNSSGGCDNPNDICQPVKVDSKSELRCVRSEIVMVEEPTPPTSGEVISRPVTTPKTTSPTIPKPTAPQVPPTDTPSYGAGKIKISSVSPSSSFDFPSTISLTAYLNQNETLNLAGWRIKSKREEFIISQAVEVYYPDGLATAQDIKLKNGDYVYIYSSLSAINRNFRVNKCMGYLETTYRFKPSLSAGCPRLYQSRADIINFSSRCQDYITSLSSCTEPLPNPPVPIEDTDCREFLRNVNYRGCFEKHSRDSDFLSREWRIFLNRNILDPSHDKIQLLNKAGTLIDEYLY